jgi:branched-chain amino acid transport system substrate-binding protein
MDGQTKKSVGKWLVLGVIVVILVLIAVFASRKPAETGPIELGWIGPLTGDGATIGESARQAVDLAVGEINSAGGVNGRQIQMIYEDGKCNGKDSVNAATKLINVDKVPAILGGLCSGETIAIADQANKANVVLVSGCASSPAITGTGVIRDVPSDSYQGSFAADYVYNVLGKKNVAIMAQENDWAMGIKGVFKSEFTKIGGIVVDDESFSNTSRDFRTQFSKIKAANPDIIYFVAYAESTIPALKQAADIGVKASFFGGDAWGDPSIAEKAGKNAEGIMYTQLKSESNQGFIDKMKAKTGGLAVGECSAPSYDAAKILAQAIGKAGTSFAALHSALLKTDYKNGVYLNEIKFDSNGDLIGADYAVKKIVNGKAVVIQ